MHKEKFSLLDKLPDELTLYTLNFLDRKALARAGVVSKKFHDLSQEDGLWKKFVFQDLTHSPKLGDLTHKEFYLKIYHTLIKYADNLNNSIPNGEFKDLSPLPAAAKAGCEQLLLRFLSKRTAKKILNEILTSSLNLAIEFDNEAAFRVIIKSFIIFSDYELAIALNFAIKNENTNIIDFILKKSGYSILKLSAVEYCINMEDPYTPILYAAFHNKWNSLLFLLEKGAQPIQITENGWSALHFAAEEGRLDVVSALLAKNCKAMINDSTQQGYTPLLLAFCSQSESAIKVIRILLDNGATFGSSHSQFIAKYSFYSFVVNRNQIAALIPRADSQSETDRLFESLINIFGNVQGPLVLGKILSSNFNDLSTFEFTESYKLIKALGDRKILVGEHVIYNDLPKAYFALLLLKSLQKHYAKFNNVAREHLELRWIPHYIKNYAAYLRKEVTNSPIKNYEQAKTVIQLWMLFYVAYFFFREQDKEFRLLKLFTILYAATLFLSVAKENIGYYSLRYFRIRANRQQYGEFYNRFYDLLQEIESYDYEKSFEDNSSEPKKIR